MPPPAWPLHTPAPRLCSSLPAKIPRGQIGKDLGAVHEVFDQSGVMSPVTKWRRQVLRPREIPDAVTEAFRQMRTGRPRPVLIDIPPEVVVEREEVAMRNPATDESDVDILVSSKGPQVGKPTSGHNYTWKICWVGLWNWQLARTFGPKYVRTWKGTP